MAKPLRLILVPLLFFSSFLFGFLLRFLFWLINGFLDYSTRRCRPLSHRLFFYFGRYKGSVLDFNLEGSLDRFKFRLEFPVRLVAGKRPGE